MKSGTQTAVVVLAGIFVVFLAVGAQAVSYEDLQIGGTVPDFTLKDWTSMEDEHTLSDLQGEKVVVLEFGSSYTWSFIDQIAAMEKLNKKYRKKGVAIYGIYTREMGGDWQAKNYFEKLQRAKTVRFDMGLLTHTRMRRKLLIDDVQDTVFKAYGLAPNGVFIIGKDGRLAYKAKQNKPVEIERVIEKLIGQ